MMKYFLGFRVIFSLMSHSLSDIAVSNCQLSFSSLTGSSIDQETSSELRDSLLSESLILTARVPSRVYDRRRLGVPKCLVRNVRIRYLFAALEFPVSKLECLVILRCHCCFIFFLPVGALVWIQRLSNTSNQLLIDNKISNDNDLPRKEHSSKATIAVHTPGRRYLMPRLL